MTAQNKRRHIFNRYIEFFSQEIAETGAVQNPGHANNTGSRQARRTLQNTNHRIQRVGDTDNKRIRAVLFDPFTNLGHHLGVYTHQIITAHPWLAGHAGGDDHHICPGQGGIVIRTGYLCIKPFDRGGFSNIKGFALRNAFGDIKQDNIPQLFQSSQQRQCPTNVSGTNERNFIPSHSLMSLKLSSG